MTLETANELIGVLANTLNVVIENQNKLLALEKALAHSERVLYQNYSNVLAEIRGNPSNSIPLQELADLRAKLVQD